jgi:hypothetical protein
MHRLPVGTPEVPGLRVGIAERGRLPARRAAQGRSPGDVFTALRRGHDLARAALRHLGALALLHRVDLASAADARDVGEHQSMASWNDGTSTQVQPVSLHTRTIDRPGFGPTVVTGMERPVIDDQLAM